MIYLDIETDGLDPTQIWCAVTRKMDSVRYTLVQKASQKLSEAL